MEAETIAMSGPTKMHRENFFIREKSVSKFYSNVN